jgi:hypothetical protein
MHVTGEKVPVALSTEVAYRYWFAKTLLPRGEARYHLPCSDEVRQDSYLVLYLFVV